MAAALNTITLEQATSELDVALGTLDPLPEALARRKSSGNRAGEQRAAEQRAGEQRVVRGRLPSFPQTPDEISDRLNMAAIRYAIRGTDIEAECQREAKERTEAARAALSRPRRIERATQGLNAAAMAILPHVGLSMILQSGIGRATAIASRSV